MHLKKLSTFPELNSVLRGNLRDVPRIVSCGRVEVAGTDEFIVRHQLGERPDFFIPIIFATGVTLGASEESQLKWNSEQIALSASAACTLILFVGAMGRNQQ